MAPAAFAGAAIGGAPRGGRAPTDAKPGAAPGSPAATGTGLALASAGSLMAMGRGRAGMLPEDFRIGPLASGRSGVPDKDAAYAVAVSFLSRLVAGTVDRQEIAPESQESLADTLSYGLQKGYAPSSFRIGEPKEGTDGELAVNVRLFDANSSSEGEIYLSRAADRWLVADVQVNLADLATPSPTPKEKFFPSPYRWLLEN